MKTALVYNPEIKNYNFGKGHPFTSERFENFINFLKEKLSNFKDYFEEITPEPATKEDLKLAHSQEYIEAMEKASAGIILPNIFQYTTVDNLDPSTGYLPRGIDWATRVAVGTSLAAAKLVLEGKFKKAISVGGGLHHAKRKRGEGFCIYNDVAICAKKLLKKGVKRILILDTDAHAGNGTAEAFYEENQVLFVDIHQDPRTLYPGTGFINEAGKEKGEGFTINIPLPPGASDDSYQYVFEEIIFPIAKEFQPEIIIRNGGSDPHFADGLTNLGLTLEGFKMIGEKVRRLSKEVCGEKEVDLIASGYNQKILPLAWSALISGLLNIEIKLKEPFPTKAPAKNYKLEETKEIVKELKSYLKEYWKCFQ
ncbi:MAG: histone deacetylase family protein [Candidatus Paceibacterales bacterium]